MLAGGSEGDRCADSRRSRLFGRSSARRDQSAGHASHDAHEPDRTSLERVVVDETGLTGNWDLDLNFVNQVQDANGDGPSLFTALEEQLGLKLESGRARVDVIVIDRLERPTPD